MLKSLHALDAAPIGNTCDYILLAKLHMKQEYLIGLVFGSFH